MLLPSLVYVSEILGIRFAFNAGLSCPESSFGRVRSVDSLNRKHPPWVLRRQCTEMGETRNSQRINLTGAKSFSIGDITNVGSPNQDRSAESRSRPPGPPLESHGYRQPRGSPLRVA